MSELREGKITGTRIKYPEFEELYKKHGKGMEKWEFASEVSGKSIKVFYKFLSGEIKTIKIITYEEKEMIENENEEIFKKLDEKEIVDGEVTYDEFCELHKKYGKGMKEWEFAYRIFSIKRNKLYRYKREGKQNVINRFNLSLIILKDVASQPGMTLDEAILETAVAMGDITPEALREFLEKNGLIENYVYKEIEEIKGKDTRSD